MGGKMNPKLQSISLDERRWVRGNGEEREGGREEETEGKREGEREGGREKGR